MLLVFYYCSSYWIPLCLIARQQQACQRSHSSFQAPSAYLLLPFSTSFPPFLFPSNAFAAGQSSVTGEEWGYCVCACTREKKGVKWRREAREAGKKKNGEKAKRCVWVWWNTAHILTDSVVPRVSFVQVYGYSRSSLPPSTPLSQSVHLCGYLIRDRLCLAPKSFLNSLPLKQTATAEHKTCQSLLWVCVLVFLFIWGQNSQVGKSFQVLPHSRSSTCEWAL